MRTLLWCLFLGFCSSAIASPYYVEYSGNISNSAWPEIKNGETYSVTLVVDNGGATTNSQTWNGSQLVCLIFKMNNAQDVGFAHDIDIQRSGNGVDTISGLVITDAGGNLTSIYSDVSQDDPEVDPGSYSVAGFWPRELFEYYLNNGAYSARVFVDYAPNDPGLRDSFSDASGGIPMNTAYWSDPLPFEGDCRVEGGRIQTASPVPALSSWNLLLLGFLLAMLARLRLRATS